VATLEKKIGQIK